MTRLAAAILAVLLAAPFALRAQAPDADALRRDAASAEEARVRRTLELAGLRAREMKLDEARALYGEALALRPDDADVMDALLGVLRRQGDSAAQLPLYEKLALRRPGDAQLAFDAAACLWRLGRTAEAKQAWGELLRRFPTERSLHDWLVEFHLAGTRPADARAALEERRRRFGDDAESQLVDAHVALMEGKPGDAVDRLLAALDGGLDDADRDRAETLLAAAAAESGRTDEVAGCLAESLAATDAKIAARCLDLAQRAADAKDFPAAAALAEQALGALKDPVRRAEVSAKITAWKAAPRQ